MRTKEAAQTITVTSPGAPGTVVSSSFKGDMLRRADMLIIDAALLGGTGGTLDVYLQRKLATNEWVDWVHFPQLAAGATKKYSVAVTGKQATIVDVGGGTDASPGVTLAANTVVDVIPGDDVRIVFVAGGGTTLGASNKITITPYSEKR